MDWKRTGQKLHHLQAQLDFSVYLLVKILLYYLRRFRFISSALLLTAIVWLLKSEYFPSYSPPNLNTVEVKTVSIPRGSSLRQISNILVRDSLLTRDETFVFLGKICGIQNRLKAGIFEVPRGLHPWHLLNYLLNPKSANIQVTLPEGLLARDIAGILQERLELDSSKVMNLVQDSAFCHSIGIKADNLEGYLLPETYLFTYDMSEEEIIRYLVQQTLSLFTPDSVQEQMRLLKMNIHEVLTLASIIEGEVVLDSERVTVSSVYHNRLRRGWRLQADPTIQYILPGKPRRLLLKHLQIDSPYNTYLHKGLPPGPINNPGRKSILAALYPANTHYMYFVATGDGGHRFSRTSAEHARYKAQFDRVRRAVRHHRRRFSP